jgi:flagellar basal body-associated protein FliL
MADKKEKQAEVPQKGGGGGMGRLIMMAGVVLVAAIGGLATYLFVLAPVLKDPAAEHGEAHAEEHGEEDHVPHHAEMIELPTVVVNVIREGDGPAPYLQFGVTLECSDHATAQLVERYKARFVDIINKLHDSRTRKELDDTLLIKESIQRQAMQKTNELLKKLQEKPSDDVKITAVLHHTFVVQDPS